MRTNVKDNSAGGDIAGRDVVKTYNAAREPTAMTRLVEQYLAETLADQTLSAWSEKLEHFLSNATSSDVRGLECAFACEIDPILLIQSPLSSKGRDPVVRPLKTQRT
jgi:hypothetical protein